MWLSIFLACSAKQTTIQTSETPTVETVKAPSLYPQLQQKLDEWSSQGKPNTVTADREQSMMELASWIREQNQTKKPAALIFVCTHNSRRSHMSRLI